MNLSDLLRDASLIIASWTAIYGITAWRREHLGRRRMELAEEGLTLIYDLRDRISFIRSNISFTSEAADREREDQESDSEARARDIAYTTLKRINDAHEDLSRFEVLRYSFEALFGEEAVGPFKEIKSVVSEVRIAANMYPQVRRSAGSRTEDVERLERKFWEVGGDDDPLKARVMNAVSEMEKICRPILLREEGFLTSVRKRFSGA